MQHNDIFFITATSKFRRVSSNTSSFHVLCSKSIKLQTFVSVSAPPCGEMIFGECFDGNHLSSQISIDFPLLIL